MKKIFLLISIIAFTSVSQAQFWNAIEALRDTATYFQNFADSTRAGYFGAVGSGLDSSEVSDIVGDSLDSRGAYVTPEMFEGGSLADGVTDNTTAFNDAFTQLEGLGGGTLLLGDGKEYVFTTSLIDTFSTSINIIGKGGSKIKLTNDAFFVLNGQTILQTTLRDTVSRGSYTVYLTSTSGLQAGDLLYFSSPVSDTVELSWVYHKEDIHLISVVDNDSTVTIAEPLNFDYYSATATIESFRSKPLFIDGVDFDIPFGSTLQLHGFKNAKISNSSLSDSARGKASDGIYFSQSFNCYAENIELDGLRYGIGVSNGTRNTYLSNISSFYCIEPIVPSTWCDGLWVDGLVGQYNEATIDAHPSFNINYKNVNSYYETSFSNLRCLGGSLENIYVHSVSNTQGFSFGLTSMSDDSIALNYSYRLKNVEFVTPNANSFYDNVISIAYFDELHLDNVRVNNIEAGLGGNEGGVVYINNSNIGSLKTLLSVRVDNTIFDATKLTSDVTYALSLASNANPVFFYSTKFIGYDSLLSYDSSQDEIRSFVGCEFSDITAFSKTASPFTGSEEYNYHFTDCDIDVDVWDSKIENSKTRVRGCTFVSTTLEDGEGVLSDYLPLAGGTLTGDIRSRNIAPNSSLTYDIGSATNGHWNNMYLRNWYAIPSSSISTGESGSTFFGDFGHLVIRDGDGTAAGAILTVNGSLNVDFDAQVGNDLTVGGDLIVSGSVLSAEDTVFTNIHSQNNLVVDDSTTLSGTVDIGGDVNLQNNDLTNVNTINGFDPDVQNDRLIKLDSTVFALSITSATGTDYSNSYFTGKAFTIDKLDAVLRTDGGANDTADINIYWSADISSGSPATLFSSDSRLTNVTTGHSLTSFNDATVPANVWVWMQCNSIEGTINQINVTVRGRND